MAKKHKKITAPSDEVKAYVQKMAEMTGISMRTAWNDLETLIEQGWVETDGKNIWKSAKYYQAMAEQAQKRSNKE